MDGEHEHPVIGTFDCYLKVQQFDAVLFFYQRQAGHRHCQGAPRSWPLGTFIGQRKQCRGKPDWWPDMQWHIFVGWPCRVEVEGFQEAERRRGVRAVIRAFNVCLTIRQVGPGGSLGPPRGTVGHGKQGGGTSTTNHDGALNVCLTSCRDRQAWEKVGCAGKGVIRETPTALFILDLGSTASWQVALGNTTMYIFYHVCLHCS